MTATPRPAAWRPTLGPNLLTALVAAYTTLACSQGFWRQVLAAGLPEGWRGGGYLLAVGVLVFAAQALLLSALAWRGLQKPALVVVLLLSAGAAYFIDSYGVVVDRHALQSVLETDLREGSEWLSWRMGATLLVLGVLPALTVLAVRVPYRPWPRELLSRALFGTGMLALVAASALGFSRDIASLARNHAEVRHLATPMNLVLAVRGVIKHAGPTGPVEVAAVGGDVHAGSRGDDARKPLLLVLVVGESARASSFGLAGYGRDTTPELAALDVTFFSRVSSCGTNTATSVPCMFSNLGRRHYEADAAKARENLLDVLAHAGLAVEWEDNNTGSKGVAARQREEDMARVGDREWCDEEGCLDEVLVRHLQVELERTGAGDKVFVLHQIGSHGPAYYRRYPKAFERFTPTCDSNALQTCTEAQVRNTYDNTIAYTDHVLAELVRLLESEGGQRTAALLYVSDHGESTGESGFYLHGAPYVMAPDEQTHVPMLLWTSPQFRAWRGLDPACVQSHADRPLSHDNLFHSVLGLLDLQTRDYDPALDALAGCAPA